MSKREEDLLTLVQLQEAAKRVMVVVKKHRRKKHEAPEMPTIPSALLTIEEIEHLGEDYTFYVFRTDTNAVLARGIQGFEAAKARANQLRKSHGLKWDQVKFRADRGAKSTSASSFGRSIPKGRMDVARNYNPSKRGRFRGYYDAQGNFNDKD